MSKTNALRILDANGIKYSTKEYDFNEDEIDAISVANKINESTEIVFKTLVAKGDKSGYVVFVLPGNFDLDMKKAAKVSNNKSVELIKLKDLQTLTGYLRGGCSPIGMKKQFPTYVDETAILYDEIYCSAGIRGMQVRINPNDLVQLIDGEFADII